MEPPKITHKLALYLVLGVAGIIIVGLVTAVIVLATWQGHNSCDPSIEKIPYYAMEGNTTALPDEEKMRMQEQMLKSVLRCEPMIVLVSAEELDVHDSLRDETLTTRVPVQRCPAEGLCYGATRCRPRNSTSTDVYLRYLRGNSKHIAERKIRKDLECLCQ